jgi:hypothetical protein
MRKFENTVLDPVFAVYGEHSDDISGCIIGVKVIDKLSYCSLFKKGGFHYS